MMVNAKEGEWAGAFYDMHKQGAKGWVDKREK